ncbi:uncharacterized protein LOC110989300 [Acanthaster planci]|uniref:Uncharacterized protein LOC110989300 n=1 Tax=Acanthaster planci TaxID=133434 RepID=A0A8B7ZW13_ACAPL|nr:uncharacterized protein LOC110989300 [Acanthaster planci]XP_022109282.1 uncharacterized protein LOC110989300 [Acanthaster planci]XP_022109283.1 uncharacterized protein LOC110989300 [Acanthaster planci]
MVKGALLGARAKFASFISLFILVLVPESDSVLRGHRQELGRHCDPIGHIEVLETLPSPGVFWDRYASQRHPVLLRGAARHSRGMKLWSDEYLARTYGDLKVKIESKAEKDTSPTGAKGLGQDTLGSFLAAYQMRNAYVVSQLPDPMASEVSVLPFLTCGTFRERILEANLWMSSGGTKSLLHRDADNAINCLFAGRKDWIFIHPSFEDRIPIAKEDVEAYGGFALLDPDSVDLERFPAFADVDWSYANITAGDCLFLPYGYWHQVRSYERNQAVSVLFSRLTEVDLSDCHDNDLHYTPLSEVNMVYTYDGYGDQTMGDTDPFELNDTLKEWCANYPGALDWSGLLMGLLKEYGLDNTDDPTPNHILNSKHREFEEGIEDKSKADVIRPMLAEATEKMIDILDTNHDGQVSCDGELSGLPLSTLKTLANILDGDSANTEDHEYVSFSPQAIRGFLMECMQRADTHSNGELAGADFLDLYQAFGGSIKGGKEVLSVLDEEGNGFISREELHSNLEKVLMMYSKKAKPDSSNVLWEREKERLHSKDLDNRLMEDQQEWEKHIHDDL